MGTFVLKDSRLYLGGYNLSGDLNNISMAQAIEAQDRTNFASGGARQHLAGLSKASVAYSGFFQANDDPLGIDDVLHGKLTLADEVLSVALENGNAGSIAHMLRCLLAEVRSGGNIGEIMALNVNAAGSGPMIRATIMENGTRATSWSGTAYELGAVTATQKLYAALHVLSASAGDTLDVTIESDDAQGFGDPVTRITFTQATAVGAQWATPVAGPITDTWWRAKGVIGGVDPSFQAVVLVGIF